MKELSILIGADIVPTVSNFNLFKNANAIELIGEGLNNIFNSSDFRIFNLESPLCDSIMPILKNGPNLYAPVETVNGLKALNISLVTLANNHILDQGVQGLESTINALISKEISFVGAGRDLNYANKPYILEKDNTKVGVYACTENEFSTATQHSPGANPFDPLESLDHVKKLKSTCDYLIVLYHGGKEHYRYPSKYLQKVCRKLIEKGADIVICQHSHCIGCYEEYLGKNIIYGQGNFLFDGSNNELWNTGLLLNIKINRGVEIEYIPIVRHENVVRLADKYNYEIILEQLETCSNQIKKEGFLENEYKIFANEMFDGYLYAFHGSKLLYKIFNKIGKRNLIREYYSNTDLTKILNYTECEAHRELFTTHIKSQLAKNQD